MKKNIIIVGAGISGLSAGCYAQMNGFDSAIYEMHNLPGGLCTAWERKGYKFDISMHMLTGSVSGPFHRMWQELGVIDKFKFHFHDHVSHMEGMGKKLTFTTDRRLLEEQMIAISPEDEKQIKEFTKIIFGPDMMKAASLKPQETRTLADRWRVLTAILPLFRFFAKYNKMTVQEFAAGFRDPFLQKVVQFFIDAPGWPMPKFPMVAMAGFIKSGITEAGTPLGGSREVAFHLADLYKSLQGKIHYRSRIKDLIVKDDRVSGIKLEDGQEHMADRVIWAGDGHHLIFNILNSKYINEDIRKIYNEWMPVKPIVHVMIGVNMDLSGEPHRIIFEPDQSISIAGREHKWITVLHHCFDKLMAPKGKSAVEVWFDTEYDYWEDLAKNRKEYKAEKKRIADYAVDQLEKRWPGFKAAVEVIDVPTPATYHRYTGNWKGSPDGWYVTPENMNVMDPVRKLPGLEGLYMVGQWTAPFTGTVIAALTGRQAVEVICKEEGRGFKST